MFYSHEILSNSRYGVATVWLVATVGKGTQKRVTRKAIQDVDVPKACETILDPGAPLALRLQGNLLYGVSRVYAQQCGYVLSDAEKTQSDMKTFFRILRTSDPDPKAGKAKRHQITLEDDPNFDPLSVLPNLDMLNSDKELFFLASQTSSANHYSQFTPLGVHSQNSSSSGRHPSLLGFDFPHSSQSPAGFHLPHDLGRRSSSLVKPLPEPEIMGEFRPFGEDDFEPGLGVGLDFDLDGNLIGVVDHEEPELPPMPGASGGKSRNFQDYDQLRTDLGGQQAQAHVGEDALIFGEAELPDAQVFPAQPAAGQLRNSQTQTSETTESEEAVAPSRRAPRRKFHSMIDEPQRVSNQDFRHWTADYAENMMSKRRRTKATTQNQARKNAIALLFDNGIGDVGAYKLLVDGIAHPLADTFAGLALKAHLRGLFPEDMEEYQERRGHVRKAREAFGDEDYEEGGRNVRPRGEDGVQFGRAENGAMENMLVFGDDSAPEIGMEGMQPMADHHSSSMMPWSRQGSVVPGSSVRGPGSAQKPIPQPSPLLGRGSVIKSIERHSDPVEPHFGSDGFGDLRSQGSSMDMGGPVGGYDFEHAPDTQGSAQDLNKASQEFLGYAIERAVETGVSGKTGNGGDIQWVDFEQLAEPGVHTKGVAAQAFLHVLSLATKNVVSVKQEGQRGTVPYGAIRISITITADDTSWLEPMNGSFQ